MSPYRRRDPLAAPPELPPPDLVHEDRVLPSDAEPLEQVIERRYKHLISQSMHPKDMSAALAGAAKWVAIKRGLDEQQGWGEKLKGTISDDG